MKKTIFAALCILAMAACTPKPIKTVLITGQNNHNWPVSHPALQQIMQESGMFTVDLAISPAPGEDFSNFNVDFSKYDLVVLDYNGDPWNDSMKQGFLDFVQGGGGVVIYHAADNAFTEWDEFNKIIALGGWGGRDETSGPYTHWKDGKLIQEQVPGPGGSHGMQHEYVMTCRCPEHPIVKGLPLEWTHGRDELYDRMRGPGNIKDLLYTAYSPVEKNGSGYEEPLVFTVDYGKARIFHLMIGHVEDSFENSPALQCIGFQTLLLRGGEWAATGKVTQKVPDNFPGLK